jgi:hypothetical protein
MVAKASRREKPRLLVAHLIFELYCRGGERVRNAVVSALRVARSTYIADQSRRLAYRLQTAALDIVLFVVAPGRLRNPVKSCKDRPDSAGDVRVELELRCRRQNVEGSEHGHDSLSTAEDLTST